MALKTLWWAVLCAVLLAVVPVFAQGIYEPVFTETDCWFDLPGVVCGYLTVPEDRGDPMGNQVELAVAIIESQSANPLPDPVIYLEGGPGGAALLGIESLLDHPLLADRDLIVFDQRGTGFSVPSLNCYELEEDEGENAVQACRDRLLDEGVNLDAYNTAATAADVNDLRLALGYEQVNLLGVSYGTKAALTTLRDFPTVIRSAVVDSVYPPEIDDLVQQSSAFVGAYEALFDRCAADADCADAFPDLEANFYGTLDSYNETPLIIETDDGELELTGDEILGQLFQALYDSTRLPYLPYALDLLSYTDDEEAVLEGYDVLTGAYLPDDPVEDSGASAVEDSAAVQELFDDLGDIDDSEGQAYSVDCSEEYQLSDTDAAYAAAEDAPGPVVNYLISGIDSAMADCAVWNVETANPREALRVSSDVPVLLLSGAMDPITPVAAAASAALGLPAGTAVVFPVAGHGISFTDTAAGDCAKSLVLGFLDDPTAPVDTACVAQTDGIAFYTGE